MITSHKELRITVAESSGLQPTFSREACGGGAAAHPERRLGAASHALLSSHSQTAPAPGPHATAKVPELLEQQEDSSKLRSVSGDLNVDPSLQIDVPDALSEREKVQFTGHTKTTLLTFQSPEFSVTRQHEDFVWLRDTLTDTTDYAWLINPPAPAKPDFDGPREKTQKLGEGEGSTTKEEFVKMKQKLEVEYLAVFKKTVSSHEVFLQWLSSHPVLSKLSCFLGI